MQDRPFSNVAEYSGTPSSFASLQPCRRGTHCKGPPFLVKAIAVPIYVPRPAEPERAACNVFVRLLLPLTAAAALSTRSWRDRPPWSMNIEDPARVPGRCLQGDHGSGSPFRPSARTGRPARPCSPRPDPAGPARSSRLRLSGCTLSCVTTTADLRP